MSIQNAIWFSAAFGHILLDERAAKQRADESSATLNVPERLAL